MFRHGVFASELSSPELFPREKFDTTLPVERIRALRRKIREKIHDEILLTRAVFRGGKMKYIEYF